MRLAERRVASGRFQEEEEDGDDEAIQIENTFYEADDNKVFASCSQKKVAVTLCFPQQCSEFRAKLAARANHPVPAEGSFALCLIDCAAGERKTTKTAPGPGAASKACLGCK